MRVCLLNDSFPPILDGVANAVKNYAAVIQRSYGDVMVATPSFPGAVDQYPYAVVRYPSIDTTKICGYRAGLPLAPEALGTLQKFQPDIIHSHCPVVSTLLARTLRSCTDAPIVFTYHTKFDIDIARSFRSGFLQEQAIRLLVANISACNEVWVVSHGAGENLRSLGYTGNYQIMENGVDFPLGRVSDQALELLQRQYPLPQDGRPLFLFVGRMMWYKGLRTTLDALAQLKSHGQLFSMVFIGDGADRRKVEDYARKLGLEADCLFTGAIHDREVLRSWYCRSNLFLFPSTFDTNGIVVREAAACSLPSLLIRGSCAAEGIEDGVTGLLMEDSPDHMASILLKFSQDLSALRRIGETATEKIYLSWEDSIKRAVERYSIVLDNYHSGRCPALSDSHEELFHVTGELLAGLNQSRQFRESIQHDLFSRTLHTRAHENEEDRYL